MCCLCWEVDVDDKAWDYYKTVEGEFGDRLKAVMVDNEAGKHFQLRSNGRCPFLNDTNLCDLYTALGEDKLCDTCTNYPRFIEEYGSLREIGIALSCKTAANLILKDSTPTTFVEEDTDEMITSYNDIDPELYMNLVSARKVAFSIAQNRNITIKDRIVLLLKYSEKIQKCINKNKLSKIAEVRAKYSDAEHLQEIIQKCHKKASKKKNGNKYATMVSYLNLYKELEAINAAWPETVENIIESLHKECLEDKYQELYDKFEEYYSDKMYEFEHLMVYFIYRYFYKTVNDDNLLSKMKMAVVSYLVIKEMDVAFFKEHNKLELIDQIEIMHMYSRELEHSYENFDLFQKILTENEIFDTEKLIAMVLQ